MTLFSEVEHKHENPVASLDYARDKRSIKNLLQHMNKKHSSRSCLTAMHPKQEVKYSQHTNSKQHSRKTSEFLVVSSRGATLAPAKPLLV